MTSSSRRNYDVVVAGGGIVGTACALACAQAGLKIALVERDILGGGATAAGMGHIVVMDDSEAQFALTRRSQQLWQRLAETLPVSAEFETTGTIWVAADDQELAEAQRKREYLEQRSVPSRLLSSKDLWDLEPNLRSGMRTGIITNRAFTLMSFRGNLCSVRWISLIPGAAGQASAALWLTRKSLTSTIKHTAWFARRSVRKLPTRI